MYILGINSGLNSSAVLMRGNKVVFAIQEERLCRIKNQAGFPSLSIKAALDHAGIKASDISLVVMGGKNSKVSSDRLDDLKKFHNRYNAIKKGWFGQYDSPLAEFARKGFKKLSRIVKGEKSPKTRVLEDYLSEEGLLEKHARFDHHLCHASAAYYGLSKRDKKEKYLVFALDGGGDHKTSAVYIAQNNKLQEIAASCSFSPACLYAHITYIMGFMPHEHEYKLMGLSPYAHPEYGNVVKDKLAQFTGFDPKNALILTNSERYPGVDNSTGHGKQELIEDLFKSTLNVRFDTLAAGLQMLSEEFAVEWVKAGIKQTGIRNILLSGGFFMNVKANKLIAELPEVESVACFPSCGDESNAFGAAFLGYEQLRKEGQPDIEFGDICLGIDASFDIEKAKREYQDKVSFTRVDNINEEVVKMLMSHEIIARCSGKMEFGARSLGNRSIIASPDDPRIINKINAAIKKRDFWMPFAPASTEEIAETAVVIPESIKKGGWSPYMMMTFNARPEAYETIIAGIHQADKTARLQTVHREIYPEFHDIITRFYAKTGIPAVLNTSFNLHGYPIVRGACDAIDVYLNSALDVLIVDDYIIRRK
ncbi:MAG: hypothetical protein A2X49_03650 [Lentisphaerae bacterium GWF2_52_8]|nr:MAG: hypothetical protein A2X49_03650 [Lentisphaerae bacterium GWF2_52_8]